MSWTVMVPANGEGVGGARSRLPPLALDDDLALGPALSSAFVTLRVPPAASVRLYPWC